MAWGHRTASEEPLRKSGLATASYFARCERARCRHSAAVILSRFADTRVALMLRRRGHYDDPRLPHGNERSLSHELTIHGICAAVGSGWPQKGSELNWYGGIQAMDARAEPT